MNLQPLKDRIVVQPDVAEEQTPGGIYLTDASKDAPRRGTVLAVGNDVEEVTTGNTVAYGRYSGTELDGYLILREDDILAIVRS